jgi:hypothetical protein
LAAFTAVEKRERRERRERRESVSDNNQHPLVALLQMMKKHCMCVKPKSLSKKIDRGSTLCGANCGKIVVSNWALNWDHSGLRLGGLPIYRLRELQNSEVASKN